MAINTEVRHTKTAYRLQSIINSYGITPSQLAKESGINKALITRYLSGEYTPSEENAAKLASVLRVSAAWIRGEDDIENLHRLTSNYNALNELGKDRVLEYSGLLLENEKFSVGKGEK